MTNCILYFIQNIAVIKVIAAGSEIHAKHMAFCDEMSQLPRLKVKWWGRWEKTMDLEQARSLIPFGHRALAVIVEGQSISSFKELAQFAARAEWKGKESLEVAVIMPVIGG
jgi:hypothetical protein